MIVLFVLNDSSQWLSYSSLVKNVVNFQNMPTCHWFFTSMMKLGDVQILFGDLLFSIGIVQWQCNYRGKDHNYFFFPVKMRTIELLNIPWIPFCYQFDLALHPSCVTYKDVFWEEFIPLFFNNWNDLGKLITVVDLILNFMFDLKIIENIYWNIYMRSLTVLFHPYMRNCLVRMTHTFDFTLL